MYDFWFTLGAAAMDPTLLTNYVAPAAYFQFISRLVTEIKSGGLDMRRGPSTGLLERTATTTVRKNIATYLKGKFGVAAPPVGIYTAGRFCQLAMIPRFQHDQPNTAFSNILNSANKAYQTALSVTGKMPNAPAFPAAVGMCMMDAQVAMLIQNWTTAQQPDKDTLTEILSEFGITAGSNTDKNWLILTGFVPPNQDFIDAVSLLMAGDMDPWSDQGNTFEQMIFWPDDGSLKGEHAIA